MFILDFLIMTERDSIISFKDADIMNGEATVIYGLDMEVYCCEVSFAKILNHLLPEVTYTPLPKYPTVSRDLAVVCDEEITVGQVEDIIEKAAGKLLRNPERIEVTPPNTTVERLEQRVFRLPATHKRAFY